MPALEPLQKFSARCPQAGIEVILPEIDGFYSLVFIIRFKVKFQACFERCKKGDAFFKNVVFREHVDKH